MKLVKKKISSNELKKMAMKMFGGLVKAVIDIRKKIMVIDAAMHADEEKYLLETGSKQDDLWGINLYPEAKDEDFIEYDSVINLRPRVGNMSRNVEDEKIKKQIIDIVNQLIAR